MLAIDPHNSKIRKVTPNVLPCSIKHNGPVNASERYWQPVIDHEDGHGTAYFRGRKLRGRQVKLPRGYHGLVLEKTNQALQPKRPAMPAEYRDEDVDDEDEAEMEDETSVEVTLMQQTCSFDEVVVWGHEVVPEDDDPYVKGVREWMAFAEAVHSTEDHADGKTKSDKT